MVIPIFMLTELYHLLLKLFFLLSKVYTQDHVRDYIIPVQQVSGWQPFDHVTAHVMSAELVGLLPSPLMRTLHHDHQLMLTGHLSHAYVAVMTLSK